MCRFKSGLLILMSGRESATELSIPTSIRFKIVHLLEDLEVSKQVK